MHFKTGVNMIQTLKNYLEKNVGEKFKTAWQRRVSDTENVVLQGCFQNTS